MNVGRNLVLGTVAALLATALLVVVFGGEGERMDAESRTQEGKSIARGALLYDGYCASCHGKQGLGRAGVAPPLNVENIWAGRKGLAFYGSAHDFVSLTISAGRPKQGMPVWSDQNGGVLRRDQIEDLARFILNWTGPQPEGVRPEVKGNVEAGNAVRGKALFERNCAECHNGDAAGTEFGPSLVGAGLAGRGDDAYRTTINNGVPGTAMVPWAWDEVLGPQEVEDLISFVRSRQ